MPDWLYMIFSPTVVFLVSFVIFVANILWRHKSLLFLSVTWLAVTLMLTVDFVKAYGSYDAASIHGDPVLGVVFGCVPWVGYTLGGLVRRNVLKRPV